MFGAVVSCSPGKLESFFVGVVSFSSEEVCLCSLFYGTVRAADLRYAVFACKCLLSSCMILLFPQQLC